MLKANKRTLIITSILTLLPALVGLLLWNRLPDVMATHFGINNEANGFSSKAFAVFGIPLFLLALHWLCAFLTSRDPRKQNISPKIFTFVLWLIPFTSLFAAVMQYPYNLGYRMDISLFAELLIALILIVVGNYMPKSRQNYTIGIKTPWTLHNEENWNRTHRLAGYLWVIGGILVFVLALTKVLKVEWMIGMIFVMALVPSVYSFILHSRKGL